MRKSIFQSHKPSGNIGQSPSGFTLLEVLLAVVLFAIVMTILFSAFNSVFSNAEAIDDGIWAYDTAESCLNRMIADLQAVHVNFEHTPPDFNAPEDEFRVVGETADAGDSSFSRLRFTSFAHLDFERTSREGIAEIVYYVTETQESGYVLRRADSLPPFEDFEEKTSDPVLCEHIKSLAFTYFDDEGTLHDDWDSESSEFKYATPKAIGIKLEIGDESGAFSFETVVTLPVYREERSEDSI